MSKNGEIDQKIKKYLIDVFLKEYGDFLNMKTPVIAKIEEDFHKQDSKDFENHACSLTITIIIYWELYKMLKNQPEKLYEQIKKESEAFFLFPL